MNITPLKPLLPTAPSSAIVKELRANPKSSVVYFNSVWVNVPAASFLQYGFDPNTPGTLFQNRGLFRCAEKSTIKEKTIQVVQVVPQLKYLGIDSTPEFQTIEKVISVVLNLSSDIDYMYVTPKDVIAQLITYQL